MITATRIGGSGGAVEISYATSGGTATVGNDYTATSGKLSWASGDKATKTFTVLIAKDALDEPNETFAVRLFSPTGGAVLGSPSTGTVTIIDSNSAPTVRFNLAVSSGPESSTSQDDSGKTFPPAGCAWLKAGRNS